MEDNQEKERIPGDTAPAAGGNVAGEPDSTWPPPDHVVTQEAADAYADATEQQLRDSLQALGWCGLDHPHGEHRHGEQTCPGWTAPSEPADPLGTYVGMFDAYLAEQRLWIGPVHAPLVFHIKKLCRRLDQDADAPASFASAYLQAISRLERMRPGAAQPKPGAGDPLGGQSSIFDELDE